TRVQCIRKNLIRLGLGLILASASPAAEKAQDVARAAERAQRRGDRLQALVLYTRAAELDPGNAEYQLRRNSLQATPGMVETRTLTDEEQSGVAALLAEDPKLIEERNALPPATLKGSAEKKSFNLRGDARTVFEQVGAAYGIQIVFEA